MALRAGSVSGFTSTVFALASTAPAYSLAVSVGLLVSLADTRAPLVLLVSAVVMAVVVLCFAELNTAPTPSSTRPPDRATVHSKNAHVCSVDGVAGRGLATAMNLRRMAVTKGKERPATVL